jgi:hypothetical protein
MEIYWRAKPANISPNNKFYGSGASADRIIGMNILSSNIRLMTTTPSTLSKLTGFAAVNETV